MAVRKVNYSWTGFPIHSLKAINANALFLLCMGVSVLMLREKKAPCSLKGEILELWKEEGGLAIPRLTHILCLRKAGWASVPLLWLVHPGIEGRREDGRRPPAPQWSWHLCTKVLGFGLFSHQTCVPYCDSLRILFSCGSISQKEKNNLKENWITAIESLRECLMGPLINDSGSQWDIAFGLVPRNTPEAHCNEPIKRAPSSLSALAQNTSEFTWWMAKRCL